jgi:hypothetical protein
MTTYWDRTCGAASPTRRSWNSMPSR